MICSERILVPDTTHSLSAKRTAVLAIHGMGSQRPLDTVRGIVDAVWLKGDRSGQGPRRTWNHPELSGVDIDLQVITTNFISDENLRRIDFHELYWAHLMSETRAVAVLLWLFELARRGPRLNRTIQPLYWIAIVFLSLLVLSVSLLSTQFILTFVRWVVGLSEVSASFLQSDFHALDYVAVAIGTITFGIAAIVSAFQKAFRIAFPCAIITAVGILAFIAIVYGESYAESITNLLLPTLVAACAIYFTMGRWGLAGLGIALSLSIAALIFVLICFAAVQSDSISWTLFREQLAIAYQRGWIPWSIRSFWSSIASWYFIAIYLILYAAFLQPYLGDAARYFRNAPANVAVRREIRKQAVDTLKSLHLSGYYDRIVVVAHSLGTVVGYDMLRAYYSRINRELPDSSLLGPTFDQVDAGSLPKAIARREGREIIRTMAQVAEQQHQTKAWLVTDFVTLGSPLAHAYYLMCQGNTESQLKDDFVRRTREREFPTCPPLPLNGDGRLTFLDPITQKRRFHHGGQFALTRWTNLFFPVHELLWGDAIGGVVSPVFGENVEDVPIWTNAGKRDNFFAHILYWNLDFGINAPHIAALAKAIDLPD